MPRRPIAISVGGAPRAPARHHYTVGLINLPAFILGFSLATLAALIAFRGVWAVYIHSNVRLPIGPLRMLIGAPELHHWHHDRDRDAGNYANISPLMDLIFGTYRCPDHEPQAFGIREPIPRGYLAQMLYPFVPGRWRMRVGATHASPSPGHATTVPQEGGACPAATATPAESPASSSPPQPAVLSA